MVKVNDRFSCASGGADVDGVLLSLYTMLTADELAQVSVNIEDSKLQVIAPASIALKIGQMLGLPGK